jgi:hypothetical protein
VKTILVIVAVSMLGLGNDAFAQAQPKEVIVVDGQLAVSNLPASQTINGTVSVNNLPAVQDVVLQGATNPIPVVDVTGSIGEAFFGNLVDTPPSVQDAREISINIPPGKLLELKYVSVYVNGAHGDVRPSCRLKLGDAIAPTINHFFDLTVTRFADVLDLAELYGTGQWSDLPAVDQAHVSCLLRRADLSNNSRLSLMSVSWSGYLYDAPTP